MARPLVFTSAVTRQIAPWVREGASATDIAQRIGCTIGTLRVRCSQLGISLKSPSLRSPQSNQTIVRTRASRPTPTQPGAEVRLQLEMDHALAEQFRHSAGSRGLSSATLARALLEVIVQDRLYDAILDEGPMRPVTIAVRQET
jgi:hypothetical protein